MKAKKKKKKDPTGIGLNRTGIDASPLDAPKSMEGARQGGFTSKDTGDDDRIRLEYATTSEPIGTVPIPATLTGAAEAAAGLLEGQKASALIDKIGERIAFERTGVRLYEALLVKHAAGPDLGEPTAAQLEEIRDEEHEHFLMLVRAMESLGGDPTAETPSADVAGVLGSGILKVIADPRTTIGQGLEAILVAELADNACFELLIELANGLGQQQLLADLRAALRDEEKHLRLVKGWVASIHARASGARRDAA